MRKTNNSITENCQWQAYLSNKDLAIAEHDIVPNDEQVRIVSDPRFPLFHLVRGGKKLGTMTPQELLYSMGDGNIEFGDYFDRAGFIEALTNALSDYDRIRALGRKLSRVATIAGALAVAGAAVFVAMSATHRKK